jgi:Na+/H+ antiporter NhaC
MVSSSFEDLEPEPHIVPRARNGVLPIVTMIVVTLFLIYWYGRGEAAKEEGPLWRKIIAYLEFGESVKALFWGSLAALLLAAGLSLGQRLLSARQVASSALRSAVSLAFALVILILAWAIGETCSDVGTNHFLTAAFGDAFSPWMLPSVLFLLSALVAFSTGTSYGTMAILLPNVVVLAHTVGAESDIGGPAMMLITIGAVLEGSIFGDHCSPISDTTVLSSVATGSDHLHHVRTQAPYAVLVMVIAMVCGYLPMAIFGTEYWVLSWLAGIAALVAFLLLVGRSPERARA